MQRTTNSTAPRRAPSALRLILLRLAGLAGLACLAVAAPATALAGTFAVLSYNVQGLPPEVIGDRSAQMAEIGPLLEDFHLPGNEYEGIASIVALQELFDEEYYKLLTDVETVSYAYITAKDAGGPAGIGDGLNLLSDFKAEDFTRTQWSDCFGAMGANGGDCDTNKGFSRARVYFEDAVFVDVYNLHADAGQDDGSREARRSNIKQLTDAINTQSPAGTPVIVLGDTNSLYTRVGNDNLQDLLAEAGLVDVWVQLRRSGIVPGAGAEIEDDCKTNPGSSQCELVDKVLYRDGASLVLAPQSYDALKTLFSDEIGEDLSDHVPVAVTFDYAVVTTTTTSTSSTSSTSTSTSTTIPGDRPCGDPVALQVKLSGSGPESSSVSRAVVAGDALFVLKVAVGTFDCALCTCDVNDTGSVSATDALIVLKVAVGQLLPLNCPPCV